ncbi:MAG: pantetheine-phosphate adenylyltransferase [Clostridia bacterium]|nr:pantetheine-phosphate adenylyltransferase [Clostridia bacterium]
MNKRKCVFAGSFDPPTLGHKAVIDACLKMFDEVVVAILVNPNKQPYFSVNERKEMLVKTVQSERVRVVEFSGTVAELLAREGTDIYVRGLRNATDFDYENADFYASRKLNANITAVYLPCPQELLHVSSSIVRNSLRFGTPIDEYVTEEVKEYINEIKGQES